MTDRHSSKSAAIAGRRAQHPDEAWLWAPEWEHGRIAGVLLTATRIEVDRNALRVPHGRWPLTWTRTIPLDRITEVKYASSGDPPTARIDAHTQGGGSYWISGTLSGLEETKWLTAELMRLIERYRAERQTGSRW
jgi:hypothetical protein